MSVLDISGMTSPCRKISVEASAPEPGKQRLMLHLYGPLSTVDNVVRVDFVTDLLDSINKSCRANVIESIAGGIAPMFTLSVKFDMATIWMNQLQETIRNIHQQDEDILVDLRSMHIETDPDFSQTVRGLSWSIKLVFEDYPGILSGSLKALQTLKPMKVTSWKAGVVQGVQGYSLFVVQFNDVVLPGNIDELNIKKAFETVRVLKEANGFMEGDSPVFHRATDVRITDRNHLQIRKAA